MAIIVGTSGNDTLIGGELGALLGDTLNGGAGDDVYEIANPLDQIVEAVGEGVDEVRTGLAVFSLGDNVETLTYSGAAAFTGTGNDLDNRITGGAGADSLSGGAGADTLIGGGGADTLVGGLGDDRYRIDNAGEGVDEERTSLSAFTLAPNVEVLTYTGAGDFNGVGSAGNDTLHGGGGADTLVGAAGNDSLDGGAGADVLDGGSGADTLNGGLGADSMAVGTGNDTYYVDDLGDVVTELSGEGSDTVRSALDYTLGDNVESLVLTGSAVTGTGNGLNNSLTGTAADNLLTGLDGNDTLNGGAGADTLIGGTGNDTYVVDNVGDVLIELPGEGVDTVQSSITHTLLADFENLTLTGSAAINGVGNAANNVLTGNGAANLLTGLDGDDTLNGGAGADTMVGGTGDDLDNVLTGNSGANILDGGLGADTMVGGAGNDVYLVDNVGDVVTEAAGQGTDEVCTALAAYALGANVETLTYTGAGPFNGDGNALDNRLAGAGGDDSLSGFAGDDTLIGGTGTDTAVFSGNVRDYAATLSGATWTIQALSGSDGTDTLQGVEISQFADATIRLDANNAPLIPNDLSAATNEDAAPLVVDLLQGAWDFEGGALSATGLVQTGGPTATVSLSGGALSLNPNQFNSLAAGQTAALTFAYAVSDGGASTARTLSVTVAGRNDAPVVSGPVSAATNEDAAPLVVNLLQGATDPDQGDTLTVTSFSQTGGRTVSVTRTGGALALDPAQFNDLAAGESATLTFGYGVTDGSATTAQTLNVTVQGRNDAPVAGADSFTTTYQTPLIIATNSLLVNDADPEGRTLAITALGGASNGTVQFNSDGNIVFIPLDGYHGNATFQYTVTDPQGATATATATISVQDRGWGSGTGGTLVSKPEIKVNGTASGSLSSLARLSDGGYVIAWTGVQSSGGDWDIFARRYDAHDQPVGAEFRVNTTTSQNQSDPQIAALAGGGFVVGWSGSDGSARGFYGQRYDASGAPVGGEFRANITTANDQGPSQITALRDGGYVMAWSSLAQDGDGSWASEARVFNADGTARTGEFRLNAYTNWDQLAPVVATVSDTEFLAVWSSRGQDGSGWGGIMGRRFSTATGQALSGEFQINTTTVNDQFSTTVSFTGVSGDELGRLCPDDAVARGTNRE
jgi:VCBS repeat-containing protein